MHQPTYQQRIDALRQTKIEHTAIKRRVEGFRDSDDKGNIPWLEPIPFKAVPNHASGGSYGARSIGANFRAWLEAHPAYIHPMSALAGAWISAPLGVGGWRPEDRPVHLYPLHKKYNLQFTGIGAQNHLGPDLRIGLTLGWGGLLKKIHTYRDLNQPAPGSEMADFYAGEEDMVIGIQHWIAHHVDAARAQASIETDPFIRQNLIEIADMNAWLVEHPPRTLREACQLLAWFQSVDSMWATAGAMGQLDELLRPYYEADRAIVGASSSTFRPFNVHLDDYDEQVAWFIASMLFNETHYSQISGPTPDGARDLTSPMSFLILEAVHRLRIPADIALRVHDKLNPDLLRLAVQYLFEDGTGVDYSLSKGLDEGYARNGIPLSLARMRAKVGCNWTALPGIEYCMQDVSRLCLTAPFLIALNEMMADAASRRTMDELWSRYADHLRVNVEVLKQGFDWHMAHQARNLPEIVLNLFCHGTIERGLDASAGGVDIYNLTSDGVGLATVADSFAAIEQRVVKEQRLTWDALAHHLANDYAGTEGEKVRQMLKNIPRFGSGGSRADGWAKRISDLFSRLVRDTPTPAGYCVLPGLFSHGCVEQLGQNLGATPNGRHAHAPISHSSNPDPGFMPGGVSAPTAKANAVAAVQPGWGNSAPLQMDLDSLLAHEYGGVEAVESLIKAHHAQGGTLININVISKEMILAAHADPDRYPDLVVRVTGFSAYFRSLSREYRQIVVDRVLSGG